MLWDSRVPRRRKPRTPDSATWVPGLLEETSTQTPTSLAGRAPRQDLCTHACAAELREQTPARTCHTSRSHPAPAGTAHSLVTRNHSCLKNGSGQPPNEIAFQSNRVRPVESFLTMNSDFLFLLALEGTCPCLPSLSYCERGDFSGC